jgi:hypothetical protein
MDDYSRSDIDDDAAYEPEPAALPTRTPEPARRGR